MGGLHLRRDRSRSARSSANRDESVPRRPHADARQVADMSYELRRAVQHQPARETRDVVQAGTDSPASLASQERSRALSTLPIWLRGNASTRSTRVGQYHSVMPRPDR